MAIPAVLTWRQARQSWKLMIFSLSAFSSSAWYSAAHEFFVGRGVQVIPDQRLPHRERRFASCYFANLPFSPGIAHKDRSGARKGYHPPIRKGEQAGACHGTLLQLGPTKGRSFGRIKSKQGVSGRSVDESVRRRSQVGDHTGAGCRDTFKDLL